MVLRSRRASLNLGLGFSGCVMDPSVGCAATSPLLRNREEGVKPKIFAKLRALYPSGEKSRMAPSSLLRSNGEVARSAGGVISLDLSSCFGLSAS